MQPINESIFLDEFEIKKYISISTIVVFVIIIDPTLISTLRDVIELLLSILKN